MKARENASEHTSLIIEICKMGSPCTRRPNTNDLLLVPPCRTDTLSAQTLHDRITGRRELSHNTHTFYIPQHVDQSTFQSLVRRLVGHLLLGFRDMLIWLFTCAYTGLNLTWMRNQAI